MAYLDAAQDRVADEASVRYDSQVEAVRAGQILAHDKKQYERWRSDVARRSGQRQEGKTLAQLARDLGGEIAGVSVERDGFEFRH